MTLKYDKHDKVEPRQFTVFLSQIENGGLIHDLSVEFAKANEELALHAERHSRAKGKIVVTINMAHDSNGTVDIEADIAVKLPKTKRARSVFWTDGEGNLVNKSPVQNELPFKEIKGGKEAPKAVAAPTEKMKEVVRGE